MSKYVILTDSACDIDKNLLKEWGVDSLSLTFHFVGEEKEYANDEMESAVFYDRMRNGGVAKTSAINPDSFRGFFEQYLESGADVLYLGFSSGLSTTYQSACIAAEELLSKYPQRRIVTVDTLAASAGQGLLVYFAAQKKNDGADIDAVAAYVEDIKLKLCHWFTVDDLVYLKRGGRVSSTAAFVGNVFGIKPVLHVDNEGHLVNVVKARGRSASIKTMAGKYGELNGHGTVFISHGDCLEEAQSLADRLEAKYGVKTQLITSVGTVIGAHSGPGTIALFFLGDNR